MKKIIFILVVAMTTFLVTVTAMAGAGSERKWYFTDDQFAELNMYYTTKEMTINGLTLGPNLEINESMRKIRNVKFYKSIYTMRSGSISDGYIKFYVNGDTDIHILGASKSNTEARNITIYSSVSNRSDNVLMSNYNDYKYEYRGPAGYIYLYTAGEGVRLFGITAKDYNADEYKSLEEGKKIEWDFYDYYKSDSIISANTEIDGLKIYATELNRVFMSGNTAYTEYGDTRGEYLRLNGTGDFNSRFITFSVPQNSDIYVTARSGDGISERTVLLRNTNYGLPNVNLSKKNFDDSYEDVETAYFNIDGNINTYKISYYGSGEDFALYSYDSAIKIYRITIVPRSNKVIESKIWNIGANSNFATGSYTNKTIDALELCNVYVSTVNFNGYSKSLVLKSGLYSTASLVKFNISDSSGTRGQRVKRTISVTANSTLDGTLLVFMNSAGHVIGKAELGLDIKKYQFEYTGTYDEISVYSYYPRNQHSNQSYIYSIDNGIAEFAGPDDMQKTLSVVKDQSYRYFVTCNNISGVSTFRYTIVYNSDALSIAKIGENPTNRDYKSNIYYDSAVTNITNENGVLSFDINNDIKNWSGILCPVEFLAKSTGDTKVQLMAEVQS